VCTQTEKRKQRNADKKLQKQDAKGDEELGSNAENDDECFNCGQEGILVCCSYCVLSFHLGCCDPPLETVPEGDWQCSECVKEKEAEPELPAPRKEGGVGWKVRVHWPKMQKWYTAIVLAYNAGTSKHAVRYTADGVKKVIHSLPPFPP